MNDEIEYVGKCGCCNRYLRYGEHCDCSEDTFVERLLRREIEKMKTELVIEKEAVERMIKVVLDGSSKCPAEIYKHCNADDKMFLRCSNCWRDYAYNRRSLL
jgi:hypothetical protein